MDGKPSLKGAWLGHVNHINFGGPSHISGMADLIVSGAVVVRWTVSLVNW